MAKQTIMSKSLLEKYELTKGNYVSLLVKILKEPNAKELCEQALKEMKEDYKGEDVFLEYLTNMYTEKIKSLPKKSKTLGFKKADILRPDVLLSAESKSDLLKQTDDLFKAEELHEDLQPYFSDDGRFPMLRHPLVYSVPHQPSLNAYANKQYEQKKKAIEVAKDTAKYSTYIFLHERPYRLNAFSDICEWINDVDYYELLSTIWRDSENIHQQKDLWRKLLLSREVMKRNFMSAEDKKVFDALPNQIKVYRGYVPHLNRFGYSHTLDKEKAEWFAKRFNVKGRVWAKTIPKDKVFAYTNERGEQEIIILPKTDRK